MATTETRTGFRLPWSSDRSQEDPAGTDAGDGAPDPAASTAKPGVAWPKNDFESRAGFEAGKPRPIDPPVHAEEAPTPVIADAALPRLPRSRPSSWRISPRPSAPRPRPPATSALAQIETDAAGIDE